MRDASDLMNTNRLGSQELHDKWGRQKPVWEQRCLHRTRFVYDMLAKASVPKPTGQKSISFSYTISCHMGEWTLHCKGGNQQDDKYCLHQDVPRDVSASSTQFLELGFKQWKMFIQLGWVCVETIVELGMEGAGLMGSDHIRAHLKSLHSL